MLAQSMGSLRPRSQAGTRAELLTGTYRYIAILAQKEMFPPEPAKKKAITRRAGAATPKPAGSAGPSPSARPN